MIVDAHQHFWDPARGDYGWLSPSSALYRKFSPADLRPHLDHCDVDGVVLVQAAPTSAETDYLLDIAAATPWIFGVVGWVDFSSSTAVSDLRRRAKAPSFIGVRPMLQDLPERDWILRPEFTTVFETIVEENLAFDALIRPDQVAVCESLARRFTSLNIVVDHAAKPRLSSDNDLTAWRAAMSRLAGLKNVTCKISGLLTELPAGDDDDEVQRGIEFLVDAFGADRLMWGSDWPVVETVRSYGDWFGFARQCIRDADQAAIFGGTAAATYNLGS